MGWLPVFRAFFLFPDFYHNNDSLKPVDSFEIVLYFLVIYQLAFHTTCMYCILLVRLNVTRELNPASHNHHSHDEVELLSNVSGGLVGGSTIPMS